MKLSFIILLTLLLGLNSGCVAASGNFNNTQTVNPNFIVGYYINPSFTPISEINFTALKSAGITDVYVLVTNSDYLPVLSQAQSKADAVGIKTNAWVYPGFGYASQVAHMNIGVQLDLETYDVPAYLLQVLDMRLATYGVPFSITVKPDGWDGMQYYYLLEPLCDYVVPQLYIGDYGQGITGLTNRVQDYDQIYNIYDILFPDKIVAGLQTYQSDQNITLKSPSALSEEIKSVQPYTHGVILFRYGLSNYDG